MKTALSELRVEYRRLQRQLARTGWISHGYVQDRGPGAGGPCYQWSRKERKKTVSVALSEKQYRWMKEAIANWQHVQETLKRMQQISRSVLFRTIPEPPRRKSLSKSVLGLN
jgi:hypothetical protein